MGAKSALMTVAFKANTNRVPLPDRRFRRGLEEREGDPAAPVLVWPDEQLTASILDECPRLGRRDHPHRGDSAIS